MQKPSDLFGEQRDLESIAMIDADLKFVRCFYAKSEADRIFEALLKETPWRQDPIKVWGKMHLQPRLSAWYGDPGMNYSYSGIRLEALTWTATLISVKAEIEQISGARFNSVLLNQYRDQQDSVGWHSDDERELGRNPLIASLSLGETRTFKLRHKTNRHQKQLAIDLPHGSLLLMAGATQRCWQHAIDKEHLPKQTRINLTFRRIRHDPGPG